MVLFIILIPLLFMGGEKFSYRYADKWANKLIELDNKGLLSTKFGAAWQDVIYGDQVNSVIDKISNKDTSSSKIKIVDGLPVDGYPSISVVEKLNKIDEYSNEIKIVDRNNLTIATIRTDHKRIPYDSIPNTLIQSVVAAEDNNFFENNHGFEYSSFVRAAVNSIIESIKEGKKVSPKGTSSITQQVAKMFVSQLDEDGQRVVSKSIDRKLREIRIAAALRKKYTPKEIMEVYLNHCLTSSYGLIGVEDIAEGLFNVRASQLDDAEAVYISRMVKWGTNIPSKIKRQCHIDMPRIQKRLKWSDKYTDSVLTEIDSLKFSKPKQIKSKNGQLIDLANKFWLQYIKKVDSTVNIDEYNFINPQSLVRKKGNITIQLTIDLPLQNYLSKIVKEKGFKDSTIITDIRIGSDKEYIKGKLPKNPKKWIPSIVENKREFSDEGSEYVTTLFPGDTFYTNTTYLIDSTTPKGMYKKVNRYYKRGKLKVEQYYAYDVIDSRSGELLAYVSRDKLGSKCKGLFTRRVPNGSSTIKPILNALMFDLKQFDIYDKWSDTAEVSDTVEWRRTFIKKGNGGAAYFLNTTNGTPYRVKNHGWKIEGNRFVYEQLAVSNNILAVETLYRLNGIVFNKDGSLNPKYFNEAQLFLKLNIYNKMKKEFAGKKITGVRVIKELCNIVGIPIDSTKITDYTYSVALGTIEMSLLEQTHIFNMLYNNSLVEKPADQPALFVKKIIANNDTVNIQNNITRYNPFGVLGDKSTLRPTQLALFKRLGKNLYDIKWDIDSSSTFNNFIKYGVASNFAKSGTTDDIRNPFFYDRLSPTVKTNYNIWNAVLRVNLSKLDSAVTKNDIRDITISCVGEGLHNKRRWRDGKSLHRYVTDTMLYKLGKPYKKGFYSQYKLYIDSLFEEDSLSKIDSLEVDSIVSADSLTDSSSSIAGSDSTKRNKPITIETILGHDVRKIDSTYSKTKSLYNHN